MSTKQIGYFFFRKDIKLFKANLIKKQNENEKSKNEINDLPIVT